MFNSPEHVPHHKLKSLLEVPREIIPKFPDSEILKLQVCGGCQTPTSCTFPQTFPRHFSKLPWCPKPLQALSIILLFIRTQGILSPKYEPPNSFLRFGIASSCSTQCLHVAAIALLASPLSYHSYQTLHRAKPTPCLVLPVAKQSRKKKKRGREKTKQKAPVLTLVEILKHRVQL